MLNFPLKSRDPKSFRPRFNSSLASSSTTSSLEEFNFPIDLLIEILKRIPLKSLIQFTCVCKSWHSLLTSPIFISAHASFNSKNNVNNETHGYHNHLFKEALDVHTETCCIEFSVINTDTLLKLTEVDCPCPVGKKHFIVCSCDGLVCLYDFYSRTPRTAPLVLWNPSIRKALCVAPPVDAVLDLTSGGFPKLIFGFGFDSVSNEYKVVRVAYFDRGGGLGSTLLRGDVYGLSLGEWRGLGVASVGRSFSTIRWRGVCLNGIIHWICNVNVRVDGEGRVCRSVLTFKLGSESFGEIDLPKAVEDATNQTLRVVSVPKGCKDLLGVIHNFANVFSLWVMGEYGVGESWVKLFDVDFGNMLRNDMNVAVLSGEAVVVQTSLDVWMSYHHDSQEKKNLKTIMGNLDYVDRYVESLILLGQRRGVLTGKQLHQEGPKRRGGSRRGRRGRATLA